MIFFFRFFLFFCSRDFASYYADLRRNDLLNRGVLSYAVVLSISLMALFLFASGGFIYHMSGRISLSDWDAISGIVLIIGLVFLFSLSWIKSLEETIFAYSDGVLVEAVLVSKKFSNKGYKLKYQFEAGDKELTLTTGRKSYFAAKKVGLGHKVLIIYAKSSPHYAKFFNSGDFSQYCLDKSKALSSLNNRAQN